MLHLQLLWIIFHNSRTENDLFFFLEYDRLLEHMFNYYKNVKMLYVNKDCYNSENQILLWDDIYAKCKVPF